MYICSSIFSQEKEKVPPICVRLTGGYVCLCEMFSQNLVNGMFLLFMIGVDFLFLCTMWKISLT